MSRAVVTSGSSATNSAHSWWIQPFVALWTRSPLSGASFAFTLSPRTKVALGVLAAIPLIGLLRLKVANYKAQRVALIPGRRRSVPAQFAEALQKFTAAVPLVVTEDDGTVNYGKYKSPIKYPNIKASSLAFPFFGPLATLRHKLWQFHSFETDEILATMTVLTVGYLTKCVCLLLIKSTGEAYTLDGTAPGQFALQSHAQSSVDASMPFHYKFQSNELKFEYVDGQYWQVVGSLLLTSSKTSKQRRCVFDVKLMDGHPTSEQLSVVFPYTSQSPAYTHKALCLASKGLLTIDGHKYEVNDSRGAIDFSSVYAPYLTTWRWLFASGTSQCNGQPHNIGINLSSEDHYLDAENAIWIDGKVFAAGLIDFDLPAEIVLENLDDTTKWTIRTHRDQPQSADIVKVDLSFTPWFKKFVPLNTGLLDSHYIQLVGKIEGTITYGSDVHQISNVYAVTERQRCMW